MLLYYFNVPKIDLSLLYFLQLKEFVAQKFKTDLEQVCLIFAGKILKDHESLETHSK